MEGCVITGKLDSWYIAVERFKLNNLALFSPTEPTAAGQHLAHIQSDVKMEDAYHHVHENAGVTHHDVAEPSPAMQHPGEHVDVDVSGILRRDMTIDTAGDALIDMIVRTSNGRATAAEALGHREFVMTKLYRSA